MFWSEKYIVKPDSLESFSDVNVDEDCTQNRCARVRTLSLVLAFDIFLPLFA